MHFNFFLFSFFITDVSKSVKSWPIGSKFIIHIAIALNIGIISINNLMVTATSTTKTSTLLSATPTLLQTSSPIPTGSNVDQNEKMVTIPSDIDGIEHVNTDTPSISSTFDMLPTAMPLVATAISGVPNDNQSTLNNETFSTEASEMDFGGTLGTAAALKSNGQLNGCSMSEFTCTNSKCVPTYKYCDRVNDCGDNSDEPRFCTRKYKSKRNS